MMRVIRRPRRHRMVGVRGDHLKQMSDAALVVAIGRWRRDALAEAYRRHGGAVFALARGIVGSDLAEDVAQEVFVGLWLSPERFDPERGSLRSWLLAQAHGRATDVSRSDTSRRRGEAPEHRAAIQLDDIERAALELAYVGGHTSREAAAVLGRPQGAIKSRIRSVLVRLRHGLIAAGIAPA